MTIELPLPEARTGEPPLTAEQARLDFAIGLYTGRHTSVGRAAQVAGIPKVLFMQEMARRGVGMHYTMEHLLHDIEMAEWLTRKAAPA